MPAQVKPLIDKTVAEQMASAGSGCATIAARTERTARMGETCRSISAATAPAVAHADAVAGNAPRARRLRRNRASTPTTVNLTLGLQAETRVLAGRDQSRLAPFPQPSTIVPPPHAAASPIGVPIDMPFTEVNKIVEAQLKGRNAFRRTAAARSTSPSKAPASPQPDNGC